MQLSIKVALSISLVVAATGAVASWVAIDLQERERRTEFRESSRQTIDLLALTVAPAVAEGRHHRVQAVLDNVANFKALRFRWVQDIEVVDTNGRVIAALDPESFGERLTDAHISEDLARDRPAWREDADGSLTQIIPMALTHKLGVVRARLSQRHLVTSLARQRNGAIALVLGAMALVGLALALLHRHLVARRLAMLSGAATALGEGRKRVHADDSGDDEIAKLGASFNSMARSIEVYTEDLEQIITERTEELETANARLAELAICDQLTGLYNRRHFDECARRFLEVARRNERPLSLVMVDTDHFKRINDRYGHPVGDQVLARVAAVLEANARKADFVARIGGEEFVVVMPEADLALAAQAAERMRATLEQQVHREVPALEGRAVTASFGLAALSATDARLEDILAAADEALYRAKNEGRNRVCTAKRKATAREARDAG